MKVTERTKSILAFRRQQRDLTREGFRHLPDPDWTLTRGIRMRERIIDVRISTDGKSLYVKSA